MGKVVKWSLGLSALVLLLWGVGAWWNSTDPQPPSASTPSPSVVLITPTASADSQSAATLPPLATPQSLRGAVVIIPPEGKDSPSANRVSAENGQIPLLATPGAQGVVIVAPTPTPTEPTATPTPLPSQTAPPPTQTPTSTRDIRTTPTSPAVIQPAPPSDLAPDEPAPAVALAFSLPTSTATPTPLTLAAVWAVEQASVAQVVIAANSRDAVIPLPTSSAVADGLTVAVGDAALYASSNAVSAVSGNVVSGEVLQIVGRHVEGEWYLLESGLWIRADVVANPPERLPLMFPTATPIPTATLLPTPTEPPTPTPLASPTSTLQPTPLSVVVCDCSAPDLYACYNYDFATQAEAQACYEYCFRLVAWDLHRLDPDQDGQACEDLR
ncbi:MAG: hypothetical protein HC802_08305 [Caldilineaceae bacterium]|nr:hypothetical protein [Caldilineaceae bacterium]